MKLNISSIMHLIMETEENFTQNVIYDKSV